MVKPLAVLIVEDVESDAQLIVRMLTKAGYTLTFERVDTAAQIRRALEKQPWEIVISDFSMPGLDGFAALKVFQETELDIPFIVVSGTMGEETAVAMMKAGAHDYVMKGNLRRLAPAVERELMQAEARREARRVEHQKQERVKELRTLFGLSMIIEREGITLDEVYQELANILPAGWQYTEIAYARMVVHGKEFCTKNFKESAWKLSTPIKVDGTEIGKIEVGYLEKRLDEDEGPFLLEERALIDAIAERIGRLIEGKQAEEALLQQYYGLLKLNQFSIDLSKLPSEEDIEELIARQIKVITGAKVALFSEYDPATRTLTAQQIAVEPGLSKKVVGLLGTQLNNIHTTVSEKMYREISKETMARRKTLYEASFGVISRPVGEAIQKLLNVDRFIGIAFLIDGKLQGTSLLGMSKDQPDPSKVILENYILLAGWSLRRRQAEEALKENETRLSMVFKNDPTGLFIVHEKTRIINDVNDSALETIGLRKGDVVGKVCHRFMCPAEMGSCPICDFGQVVDRSERVLLKPDGTRVPILKSVVPITLKGENYLLESFIDITERKKAEEELRVKDWAIESSLNAIAISDLAGNLTYVNLAFLKLWGYSSQAEVLGKSAVGFWQTGEKATEVVEALQSQGGWVGELIAQGRDGAGFEVEVAASMVKDVTGKLVCMMASFSNITERKQAEEALRESNELLALFIKHSPIFTFIKAVTSSESRVLIASDNIQDLTGIPASVMVGKTNEDMFPADFAAKITADDWTVIGKGVSLTLDEDLNGRNYTTIKFPIIQGDRTLLAGYTIDITERKQALEALQDSEARYRALFQGTVDGILIADLESRVFIYANPAICHLLGYSEAELQTMGVSDIHPKADLPAVLAEFEAQASGDKTLAEGLPCLRKDGTILYADISAIGMSIDGKASNVGFFRDITERKITDEKLKKTVVGTVNTIALIVEAKDPYTSGHQKRVADISVAIAKELGLPEEQIQGIYFASLIHDVGKIQVPSEILSKPGKLTRLEFELIKTHSKVGYELLKEIDFPWPIAEIIYQHHERVNGSGYPRKIKGKRILIEAKIIGVADVIEAMSSHRPYRPALGLEAALDEINRNKGILYDPDIVETFIKVIKKDKTLIPSL